MALPDLNARATLNVAEFRAGIRDMLADLRKITDLSNARNTVRLTAALSGTDKIKTDVDRLTATTRKPLLIPVTLDAGGLDKGKAEIETVDETLKRLQLTVRSTRNLWQTQVLTDDQTARSSRNLRDELLRLAAAEGTTAEQVLKATQAAAQAQRTLDASQGQLTKGGFGFSASLGILDALKGLGGPVGSAAGILGRFVTDGLDKGLKAGAPQVGKGAADIGDDVINAIQGKLKIHSPSLVMIDIGKFIADGLVIGMKSNSGEVLRAAEGLAAGIPNKVSESIKGTSALNVGGSFSGSFLDGFKTVLTDLPVILKTVTDETGQATTKLADDVKTNVAPPFEGLQETLGKVSEKLQEVAPAAQEATEGTVDLGAAAEVTGNGADALAGYLGAAAAGVGLFAAALSVAVPKAAEFQASIQNIATESDLSQAQLDQLGQGVLEMAGRVGLSAQELAKASYDVVGAGVKGAESIAQLNSLTEISAKAAAAGLTDTKTSVNVITSALNAYGLSASHATQVSDVLFKTTAVGKISFEQIGKSMAVVFPLASTLGVSLEDLSASVATLTQNGVPAEQAVTGIQAALSNVLKPSSEASKLAKQLGLDFTAQGLKAKGLAAFLGDVQKATGGSVEKMGTLFGSTEAVNAVFALTSTQGAARLKDALAGLNNAAGATQAAFDKQAQTLQFSQKQFAAAGEAAQIAFGLRFLPVLTKVTQGLTYLVEHVEDLGQNGFVQFGLIVGGGTLAVGMILNFTKAITAAAKASALFQAINTAGGLGNFARGLLASNVGLNVFTGSATAASIAAAPLLTVALAIGVAFASWKLGQMIGDLKLFGDETTTVNDKLQDFFATTLFGADPKLIADMRKEEEAQDRARLALEKKGGAVDTSAAALLRQAEAEGKAAQAAQKADAARAEQLQKIQSQTKAVSELADTLEARSLTVKLSGQSQLRQDLAKIGSDLDGLRKKLKESFDGDLKNPKLTAALKTLDTQQAAEMAATRSKYAELAVGAARDAALAARKAEVDAMREGQPKIAAQREIELDQLRADTKKLADQYRDFPAQRLLIEESGQQAVAAKRRENAAKDEQAARDAAARLVVAYQGVQDALAAASASQSAADVARINLHTDRLVTAAGKDAVKIAQIQAEGQRQVQAEQERQAAVQYRATYTRLVNNAQTALASDRLTAGERLAIEEHLTADLSDLGSKFQESETNRIRERERAAVESAERIRAAQVAAVFKPVEADRNRLADLAAAQGLLKTDEARLKNEREQQAVRVRLLADQDRAIVQARQRKATEDEITRATADRKAALLDVQKGTQTVLDLEARVKAEILGTFEAVRALARFQADAGQTGLVLSQRAVARAAEEVGLAYQAARPYLESFRRSQTLSVTDHAAAREAITRLTSALQAERGALDDLKGRWDEQKTAVAGVREVITSLDDASGGSAAIGRRLDETARAYSRARTLLAQGSGNDPAGLQRLATDFQTAYQKRSAAVTAFYEAQARAFDHSADLEREASKKQADQDQKRLSFLQAQIDLRKALDSLPGPAVGPEQALADATAEVSAAYREAVPLLDAYGRGASQTPASLNVLQTATERLVKALGDQQARLEALRVEYGRQRDALSGLQGILGGFGKELGSKSLLDQALTFNQQTYTRAKAVLADLLASGSPDPAKLQAAASELKGAYDGLKGSLDDLGQGSKLKGLTDDLPALLERTGAAAVAAGVQVDALGVRLSKAEQDAIRQGQGVDAQLIRRVQAQLAPERELERQRTELSVLADARAAASQARIDALATSARTARDAGQAALDALNGSAQSVLTGLGTAALAAQATADQTGASLAAGERAYAASLRALGSLSGEFISELQRSMGSGGYQAGKALADGLAAGFRSNVKTLDVPGLAAGVRAGSNIGAGSTLNIYLDGKQTDNLPPNIRSLLYQLRDQATTEVRRGNL